MVFISKASLLAHGLLFFFLFNSDHFGSKFG